MADLNTQTPVKNVTVTARMPGYPSCSNRLVTSDQDGIFQIEFPHLRNNYPYTVELKVESADTNNSYSIIKKDVVIGGILRSTQLYVDIPMNSNSNNEDKTYSSYIIDSQELTPLKQDDATVYISRLNMDQERIQPSLVTVFPDQ